MPRRIYLFLFLIVCTTLLPAVHGAVARAEDEIGPQLSLAVTYLQYGLHDSNTHRTFTLEGTADGYADFPQLELYVNEAWREVTVYSVECSEIVGEPDADFCWRTDQFLEPVSQGPRYDFLVIDGVNGATASTYIYYCLTGNCVTPIQCGSVCGG